MSSETFRPYRGKQSLLQEVRLTKFEDILLVALQHYTEFIAVI